MGRLPSYALTEKDKEILKLRYSKMLEEKSDGDPISYSVIGRKYGVSTERARQMISQAMTKLVRLYVLDLKEWE